MKRIAFPLALSALLAGACATEEIPIEGLMVKSNADPGEGQIFIASRVVAPGQKFRVRVDGDYLVFDDRGAVNYFTLRGVDDPGNLSGIGTSLPVGNHIVELVDEDGQSLFETSVPIDDKWQFEEAKEPSVLFLFGEPGNIGHMVADTALTDDDPATYDLHIVNLFDEPLLVEQCTGADGSLLTCETGTTLAAGGELLATRAKGPDVEPNQFVRLTSEAHGVQQAVMVPPGNYGFGAPEADWLGVGEIYDYFQGELRFRTFETVEFYQY